MARHTSSIIDFNEDAMIEAVLNSSDFESSVESVVDSSIESAIRSADADNEKRFEELESRLEAATITINGLASALVAVHSRLDNLGKEGSDVFNDVCLITAKFRKLAKLPLVGRFFA
jgi:uncharacterized coiled-coil protein SlyX